MRTREEILKNYVAEQGWEALKNAKTETILEVLLDIRDLLTSKKPE